MSKKTVRAAAPTAIIILLAATSMGCTDIEQPLDRIPYFKMLYVEENGNTQFIVGGNDHLFSNISVEIDGEVHRDNFTYYFVMTIYSDSFDLALEVWDKDTGYEYQGNIELTVEDEDVEYTEYNEDDKEGKTHSSPWKKFLEKI